MHSYPNGAPSYLCDSDSLKPLGPHEVASSVSSPSPFSISLSQTSYKSGDTIQVTLSGAPFKGFLIVARKAAGGTTNIGKFTISTNHEKTMCTSFTGVTHASRDIKTSVTANWTAPLETFGDIIIKYTVVMDVTNYYFDLNSSVVKALQPTEGTFFKDPTCGKGKGCYSNCINNECDWETSWQDKEDYLIISLRSVSRVDNVYVSLGFSNQSSMGTALVYSCVLHNGSIGVVPGKTNGHRYSHSNLTKNEINNEVNNYTDGLLQCTFSVQKVTNDSNKYNLTESWYLVTARGAYNESGLIRHSRIDRNVTKDKVNLTDSTTDVHFSTVVPTATVQIGTFGKDSDCGSKKGCYSNCINDQCDLLLAWTPKGNNFEMTLKTSAGNANDYYIALGGPASVMACTVNQGNTVDVHASHNTDGYSNTQLDNSKEGLSHISGSYKDGILQCTFNRVTSSTNNSNIFDLTKQWYLITARGPSSQGGRLLQHEGNERFTSQAQIDFQDVTVDISLEASKYPMIKAHGCLMVIAWMFLASIGLGFARFLKPLWPNSMPCGVKVWFAMHRAFMVLAFVCGCIGFILIFAEVKDYSKIQGEFYTKAHPILGIITTALLVINPFMSLLRCTPDNPNRVYFNWAHRAVGTIALILSTLAITVGLYLPKAQVDTDAGLIIMIVYSAWHLFFFLIMSVLNELTVTILGKKESKPKKKGNAYVMNAVDDYDKIKETETVDTKPVPPNDLLKKFFMSLHVCVLSALTIALLYYIIVGNV
ncbi:ferric-chelate reductase 1 [Biomphalaria pfeifferi]|uniref:Ferric-chelate reductase 1 n=1 Tax=Biomphalaria pfeifferi TaxID=112525 RepID=A0AAD8B357_BIOPF|nr:ferric-chelate reductase 1 [Biomphalaria pfeifferi]